MQPFLENKIFSRFRLTIFFPLPLIDYYFSKFILNESGAITGHFENSGEEKSLLEEQRNICVEKPR